jgi:hypothetical protein
MASWVSISNIALTNLGVKRITSLTEDSAAARVINERYEDVRDAVLRAHPWNCATMQATCNALTTPVPVYTYTTFFQLPSDFLRLVDVEDYGQAYQIQGRRIASNNGTMRITYIQRVDDPNQLDALFVQAMGHRLAWEISESLTKDKNLKVEQWQQYMIVLAEARSIDSQEVGNRELVAEDFTLSRI